IVTEGDRRRYEHARLAALSDVWRRSPRLRRVRDRFEYLVAAVRMAADLGACEKLIPCHVIAMVMRVHETPDWFAAAHLLRPRDEVLGRNRSLERVDGEHVVGTDNEARVRHAGATHVRTAALGVRIDVRCELFQIARPCWRKRVPLIARGRRRRVDGAALGGKTRCRECSCRSRKGSRTSPNHVTASHSVHTHLLETRHMLRRTTRECSKLN